MKIIDELRKAGITLYVDGGKLRYRGPKEKLTPELLNELKNHKGELIEYLRNQGVENAENREQVVSPAFPCPLTEEDVAHFERAGKHYRIKTPKGDVWLVPHHTTLNRVEITGRELYEALRDGRGGELKHEVELILDSLRMFDAKIIDVREEGNTDAGKAN